MLMACRQTISITQCIHCTSSFYPLMHIHHPHTYLQDQYFYQSQAKKSKNTSFRVLLQEGVHWSQIEPKRKQVKDINAVPLFTNSDTAAATPLRVMQNFTERLWPRAPVDF